MSELTTDDTVRPPGATSEPANQAGTPSNGSPAAVISRKRRYSQTRGPNLNLSSPAGEDPSEIQELAEIEIDDFGSGIIEYMRVWKEQIISRKMTHLDIVRRYIVWSKTPLSLFQEINLQALFVYMDAYHPDLVCNSEQSTPSNLAAATPNDAAVNVNAGNPNQNWVSNNLIARALLNQSFVPVGGSNPNLQQFNPSNHTISVGNHVASGLGPPAWTALASNISIPNLVIRPVAEMTNLEFIHQGQLNTLGIQEPSRLQ